MKIDSTSKRRTWFGIALAVWLTGGVQAQQIRFSTSNDLLAGSDTPDDLYTFSVALAVERQGVTWSLEENAFTDRAAGVRFDETFLGPGRSFALAKGWSLQGQVGVVRLGRGLFGERTQNAVHRALGGERIELRYLDTSLHARAAGTVERLAAVGRSSELGPRFEADLAPGVDARALAAVTVRWRAGQHVAVEGMAGGRWARALTPVLEPHLTELAPAARLGVVFRDRLFVSWSYNDFGDEREHLTAGWRLPFGGATGAALSR